MSTPTTRVTLSQVLIPVVLVSFTVFLMLAFQMTQILRDREVLHQTKAQQEKPLEDVQKLQAQLSALALGTKKLADGGDKNAETIVARMKQAGIVIGENAPGTGAAPAAPAAAMAPKPAHAAPVIPQPPQEQP